MLFRSDPSIVINIRAYKVNAETTAAAAGTLTEEEGHRSEADIETPMDKQRGKRKQQTGKELHACV